MKTYVRSRPTDEDFEGILALEPRRRENARSGPPHVLTLPRAERTLAERLTDTGRVAHRARAPGPATPARRRRLAAEAADGVRARARPLHADHAPVQASGAALAPDRLPPRLHRDRGQRGREPRRCRRAVGAVRLELRPPRCAGRGADRARDDDRARRSGQVASTRPTCTSSPSTPAATSRSRSLPSSIRTRTRAEALGPWQGESRQTSCELGRGLPRSGFAPSVRGSRWCGRRG